MKHLYFIVLLFAVSTTTYAQQQQVVIESNSKGMSLLVNGEPLMINGMNWDYVPIGTNFSYNFWSESDDFIKQALAAEMSLLKGMGVNAIRVYTGIPKKWIEYIYKEYGIYTMLNHSFGRYGLTLNGEWVGNTEYSDPRVIDLLIKEVKQMTEDYKNTSGLLLYLLGNENNYGLFWGGAETESNILEADKISTKRAISMYKLFNKAALEMKAIDKSHPIAMCNGDLLFLNLIAEECKDIDIFGTNMYRGVSFGDAFERVKKEYGKPILFTEFGSDAFNAIANEEDQTSQAFYLKGNWKEIYENAAGLGKANNSLGGFTFQFSDGWWKFGQTKNLDVHDNNASWANGGYFYDYTEGENNMNEEWFGICAKGPTNERGLYTLYPRAAYYMLKEAHQLNPYTNGKSLEAINAHFSKIQIADAALRARGDKAALAGTAQKISLSRFTAEFTSYNTGGTSITTPTTANPTNPVFPNKLGFDHMQSFYVGVQANPAANVRANVDFNILGNVAQNPIDQIFYENRGRPVAVTTPNGNINVESFNRLAVYRASYQWNHKLFDMNGFYRTGHYHWGYEGDFFGLYPEANYGPMIDIYNGIAPLGFEMEGKKQFKGLKLAFGPQLWWGANPALLLKYRKEVAKFTLTGIYHEDLQQQGPTESSFAIPQPKTRRLTLHANRKFGKLRMDLGGIWGGSPLIDRDFQLVRELDGVQQVFQDKIKLSDTWGGKIKLTYSSGRVNWYAQSAAMGLVASGSADQTQTFTGWRLKDSGSGNQMNFLTGITYSVGNLQIAPNFLWQKPIEGPIPGDIAAPGRPRNILDDPFVVRSNRETVAGEILFTYDPTPGTWMYNWDSDRTEDAKFALSGGLVYRHLPTTQDAAIGIFPDGRTLFPFPGAAPAQDLWEVHTRIISKINKNFGFIANIYAGDAQANGSDERLIRRFGMDLRMVAKSFKINSFVRFNDWGPFDYHRDFNLTFPVQYMLDLSTSLGKSDWFDMPGTRLGIRGTYRSLDQFSPRYAPTYTMSPAGTLVPDPTAIGFGNGSEWEVRVYLFINLIN